jgi:alpha-beta hydrolase superfamily lysophospholipase
MAIEFIRTISEGKKIYGILHLPRNPSPLCVIASHGLFSSKDSKKFIEIGEAFSAQGIALIRYDHQGCGESEGDLSATTASSRIKDLEAIVDLAVHHPLLGDHFGLLGSSMGGFISIFKGAADPRVKALVLWATPALLEGGKKAIDEEAQLQDSFYDDAKRYDAALTIQGLSNCLLLHGEADELVSLSHAETLYLAARSPKHLEVFPGGDHRFTNPQHRRRAIQMSLEWFQKYLPRKEIK